MKHEVPKPSHKMTLLIRDEHSLKVGIIADHVARRTGEHIPAAFVIDHILEVVDPEQVKAALERKVSG